jgi:hypothetical protein
VNRLYRIITSRVCYFCSVLIVLARVVRPQGGLPLRSVRKVLLVGGVVAALTGLVLALVIGAASRSKPSGPAATGKCKNQAAPRRELGSGRPSSQERKASRPTAPDLTLSFDAEPADCEWDSIQPGFECANGSVDQSARAQSPSAAFVRDDSRRNVRHGKYSARVVLSPGDHAPYTCKAEAVAAIKDVGEGEGAQSWWGWSWKLPVGWRGTHSWGMLFEFIPDPPHWPSYGMLNFDAATRNSLRLGLHTGLTPNPGSGSYNAAYEKWVTLLGPGSPRPMVYGKWLDFYMHVVWRSRSSGVLEIWYRVDGKKRFTKLYSDVPGRGALIQVAPHPTLLYNTQYGAPRVGDKHGLILEGGFYRANTHWRNVYWWDGMRRRQSKAAILAGFPKVTR